MAISKIIQDSLNSGVAGSGPAFLAYKTSQNSISTATNTKVTFDSESFDTNNNFTSSTFTPTIAGYYAVSGTVYLSNSVGTTQSNWRAMIYKNGSMLGTGSIGPNSVQDVQASVNQLVYCNGTTDYIELYARTDFGSGTTNMYGDANGIRYTYFQAYLVRAA
jgi:hypothetical protein